MAEPQVPVQDELSDFEHQQAIDRLSQRGYIGTNCEVCGQPNTWVLSKMVVSPMPLSRPNIATGAASFFYAGRTMPSAPLLCTNCGNTKFINLVILGIRGLANG